MSLSRHLNKEGIAHANADSATHARHISQRSKQKVTEWIPELVEENPAFEFRLNPKGFDIGKGSYFTGISETEASVSGESFEDHCSAVNWKRRWNTSTMSRNGKKCQVRRKRSSPACEEFVVNFFPAQMRFINQELIRWETAGLLPEQQKGILISLVNEIRIELLKEFKESSGRDIVASYIHWDSNKIHIGIIHSRVGPENTLVGLKRLGTVGPWSVAQNRLVSLGLVDAGDNRLADNLERFRSRFKENDTDRDREPLDIKLHNLLDEKFSALVQKMDVGAAARYDQAQEYYKQWKLQNRKASQTRSPTSQRIAWDTVRFLTPLLPPEVRVALSIAHSVSQVFNILGDALKTVSTTSSPQHNPQPKITKIL